MQILIKMIQPSHNTSSRDKILSAVRKIQQRTVVVSDNYRPEDVFFQPEDLLAVFKDEVEAVAGQCNVFSSDVELYASIAELVSERNWEYLVTADTTIAANLNNSGIAVRSPGNDVRSMPAAITSCEALVARTGSVVMSSRPELGRQLYAFAPVHLVVATFDQLVAFPEDALGLLQKRYSDGLPAAVTFVTGPSRTADIEKTLVLGAHGPKELLIFVLKTKDE
jgi:L-lactate dehydrogenase complex protein LldG